MASEKRGNAQRLGRVTLPRLDAQGNRTYETFLVCEQAPGEVFYYIGKRARTSDGWAELLSPHHGKIIWTNEKE